MRISTSFSFPYFALLLFFGVLVGCSEKSSECEGAERCACYGNSSCDDGLVCRSNVCVRHAEDGGAGPGASAGDGGSGNGSGEGSDGGSGNSDGSGGKTNGGSSSGGSNAGGGPGSGGASGGSPGEPYDDPLAGSLQAIDVALFNGMTRVGQGCAVVSDGTVRCWGTNGSSELGNSMTLTSLLPVQVEGISTATQVGVGYGFSCVLLADKTVRCWGGAPYGNLGQGNQDPAFTPVEPKNLGEVAQLAVGSVSSCAVKPDGTIRCWGSTVSGILGNDSVINGFLPVEVVGINSAKYVGVGSESACALLEDKTVHCWGGNSFGQLGDDSPVDERDIPGPVGGLENVISLGVGARHACAIIENGDGYCWGSGYQHQRGRSQSLMGGLPTKVIGLKNAVEVKSGATHSCARLSSGKVQCWGENTGGEAGNSTVHPMIRAWDDVIGINTAAKLSLGNHTSCAILEGGSLQCWGTNQSGALGMGDRKLSTVHRSVAGFLAGGDRPAPTQAVAARPIAGNIAQIVAGGRSCLIQTDGAAKCWGSNPYNAFGDEDAMLTPSPLEESARFSHLADFHDHFCAIEQGGHVRCWGDNSFEKREPGAFENGMALSLGYDFSCGITEFNRLQCWGNSQNTTKTLSRGASAVTAGNDGVCAVFADGTMQCWRGSDIREPVPVPGITTAVTATGGSSHTCALLKDKTVRCWGGNSMGQVGVGNTSFYPSPANPGLSNVMGIDAGLNHTCAVHENGTISCWGKNSNGQLGNGTETDGLAPSLVLSIDDAVQVASGVAHSCALHANGKMSCWGNNASGALGDGSLESSSQPVFVQGLD